MACSALTLELQSNRLMHCYYLRFYCVQHGEFRAAADHAPVSQQYPCPLCDVPRDGTLLCQAARVATFHFGT